MSPPDMSSTASAPKRARTTAQQQHDQQTQPRAAADKDSGKDEQQQQRVRARNLEAQRAFQRKKALRMQALEREVADLRAVVARMPLPPALSDSPDALAAAADAAALDPVAEMQRLRAQVVVLSAENAMFRTSNVAIDLTPLKNTLSNPTTSTANGGNSAAGTDGQTQPECGVCAVEKLRCFIVMGLVKSLESKITTLQVENQALRVAVSAHYSLAMNSNSSPQLPTPEHQRLSLHQQQPPPQQQQEQQQPIDLRDHGATTNTNSGSVASLSHLLLGSDLAAAMNSVDGDLGWLSTPYVALDSLDNAFGIDNSVLHQQLQQHQEQRQFVLQQQPQQQQQQHQRFHSATPSSTATPPAAQIPNPNKVPSATELFGPPEVEFARIALKSFPSLKSCRYVDDLFDLFVVQSNCTDKLLIQKYALKSMNLRGKILDACSVIDRQKVIEVIVIFLERNRQHVLFRNSMFEDTQPQKSGSSASPTSTSAYAPAVATASLHPTAAIASLPPDARRYHDSLTSIGSLKANPAARVLIDELIELFWSPNVRGRGKDKLMRIFTVGKTLEKFCADVEDRTRLQLANEMFREGNKQRM
ncbi:hypothetical protein HDU82_001851, partial [Entophlyctis luteolus]